AFSVIPFGPGWHIGDWDVSGEVANVSISLVVIFALGSLGIYGFIVGGWASDSKYSLLGSMRICAQLVSYYVLLTFAVLGVVVMLFFGGWYGPWEPLGPLWFVLKLFAILFLFLWLRATLPRLRYDQLMRLGWKVLLPVATINALVTAALVVAI